MRGDLMCLPIERRITGLPRALEWTRVFRKVEIDMDRIRPADRSRGDLSLRLLHRRQKVPVPHQELHSTALDDLDQAIAVGPARRQRLVLHDVFAGASGPNAQSAVPFRLGADDGHLYV